MPQYWLKPLGFTQPEPRPMPNDWTVDRDLDSFDLWTGPVRGNPQMGDHDRVLFHAVIHVRVFAEAEILDGPRRGSHPIYGERWPHLYHCRVDVWVPS